MLNNESMAFVSKKQKKTLCSTDALSPEPITHVHKRHKVKPVVAQTGFLVFFIAESKG